MFTLTKLILINKLEFNLFDIGKVAVCTFDLVTVIACTLKTHYLELGKVECSTPDNVRI